MTLFGSRARGDAAPDSDMDVLLDLDVERVAFADKRRLRRIATDTTLSTGLVVSLLVIDRATRRERGDFSMFENIRGERIAVRVAARFEGSCPLWSIPLASTSRSPSPPRAWPSTRDRPRTTFSPNMCRAGVKTNVIPDVVDIEVDIRTIPGGNEHELRRHLDKAFDDLSEEVVGREALLQAGVGVAHGDPAVGRAAGRPTDTTRPRVAS